jgi:hypothetical protein
VVSVISPQLTEAPALDQEKGTLHLKGYFPAPPLQIDFEVLYSRCSISPSVVIGGCSVFRFSPQARRPRRKVEEALRATPRARSRREQGKRGGEAEADTGADRSPDLGPQPTA